MYNNNKTSSFAAVDECLGVCLLRVKLLLLLQIPTAPSYEPIFYTSSLIIHGVFVLALYTSP